MADFFYSKDASPYLRKVSVNEMVSLSAASIRYIDLNFSEDYAETDQYGNEAKMKSAVGYEDGSLDLIFDLWFSH